VPAVAEQAAREADMQTLMAIRIANLLMRHPRLYGAVRSAYRTTLKRG
jgi:hypothetical protein